MDENYDIVKKLCGKRMRLHTFRLLRTSYGDPDDTDSSMDNKIYF